MKSLSDSSIHQSLFNAACLLFRGEFTCKHFLSLKPATYSGFLVHHDGCLFSEVVVEGMTRALLFEMLFLLDHHVTFSRFTCIPFEHGFTSWWVWNCLSVRTAFPRYSIVSDAFLLFIKRIKNPTNNKCLVSVGAMDTQCKILTHIKTLNSS